MQDLTALVSALADAQRNNTQIDPSELPQPETQQQAYWVQDQLAQQLSNSRISHWKIGLLGSGDIFSAPIIKNWTCEAETPLTISAAAPYFAEGELAVVLANDLTSPVDDQQTLEAIAETRPAVELLRTRVTNWLEQSELLLLADLQVTGGLITAPGSKGWQNIDYSAQPVALSLDESVICEQQGGHPQGNPLTILTAGINDILTRGGSLKAGDIITTGTWTGYPELGDAKQISVKFAGIGELNAQVEQR